MMVKLKFDKGREYEWLIISQSYLQCALINSRILNKELSEFATTEGSPLEYCLKEIYGSYQQSPHYLIFPILFNFKHGIEIYLKAIIGTINTEFSKGHNLIELLEEAGIQDEKIKSIIKKYAFCCLFLPTNKKCDTENQFERYPQGFSYDNLVEISSIVDLEKINELINDIEFLSEKIRHISTNLLGRAEV